MAERILNTTIQLRHDTASNWTTADTVLKLGEIGLETDTRKMKIGDGETAWSELGYVKADDDQISAAEDNFNVITPNTDETDAAAIARVCTSASKGDIAVIKNEFVTGKYAYTGYVYDGTNWGAMDGNYDAENVYFKEDLTYTAAIGVLSKPSSSATLSASGKNVKQVLSSILAKAVDPSVTAPTASFKSYSGVSSATVEPGTAKSGTVSYELQLASVGSYTYGPAVTGVAATGYSLTYNDGTTTGTKDTASGSFTYDFTVGTSNVTVAVTAASVSYSAATNYGVNNLGETTTKTIAAGTASAGTKSATFTSSRKSFWAVDNTTGTSLAQNDDTAKATTSYMIRSLANSEFGTKKSLDLTIPAGANRVIIAVPGTVNWVSSGKGCEDVAGMNLDIKDNFTRTTGIKVGGADATSASIGSYAGDYTVFVLENGAGLAASTYKVRFA